MIDFHTSTKRERSNAEKYSLRSALFGTDEVLPMWVADMDIHTPPSVIAAVTKRAQHEIYGYEMMPDSAFEAQISWMRRRHRLSLRREWMFYSPSVVASINVAIRAFSNEGDAVIIQPPVYAPFESSIRHNGRQVVKNPLRRDAQGVYRFDLEDLKAKITCKTKLLILCSPHNPVGRVWHRDELLALADICLEHHIKVISDEIHSDLVYAPHVHTPFMALSSVIREITLTTIGPGKTFNLAGMSISTVVIANVDMRERFEAEYRSIHFAEGTIFGHVALETAYQEAESWLDALLLHLKQNQYKLQKVLQAYQSAISWNLPEGTYLAWLNCDKMALTDSRLRSFFIEEARLGLSPGLAFGKEGSGFMRLNFAVPSDTMDEALDRLDSALKRSVDDH